MKRIDGRVDVLFVVSTTFSDASFSSAGFDFGSSSSSPVALPDESCGGD